MTKGYIARHIVLCYSSGEFVDYPLSILYFDDVTGQLSVRPFERELPGIEYVDAILRFRQNVAGEWSRVL